MSNRNHPLLIQLEEAIDQGAWDRAEQLLRAAQQQKLTLSRYGVPLDFIQASLSRWRADAADRAAMALLTQATALAAAGDLATARERYEAVFALPDVRATVAEQAQAALTQLDERESYGENQDPTLARQLEETMAQFLAETKRRQPDLAELLRSCAVPPWWDEQMVATIRQRDDGREAIIMEKIGRFSFVHTWPDYYTYSRIARRQLLHEWDDDEDGLKRLNQRLLIDIRHRLEETPPDQPLLYERLVEANLYHTFLGDPEAGAHLLAEYFQQAEDEHRLDKARRYVLVLKDLQEYLPAPYLGYIDYAEGWLNHLHGLHNAARDCFQRLLNQPDLLPDLRARLLRAVGATYLAQQDWVAALANQREALALFRDTAESKEIADTMMAVGNTYADIARTAYGQADDLEMATTGENGIWTLVSFIARLPLVLYLAWTLNIWNPRVTWRLGQAMDWVIARFFGNAITWLTRAEQLYRTTGDQSGITQVQEYLGQIYLTLNHLQAATLCFQTLKQNTHVGTYPFGRSTLALAEIALRRRAFENAELLLQEALAIFTRFKHSRRIAQTQRRLGLVAAYDNRVEEAQRAYQASYESWQDDNNSVAATDLLHALEELPEVADAHSIAAGQSELRTYAEPFAHPIMAIFQRVSAVALWLVILLSVLISIQTENGTIVGGSIIFDRPVQRDPVEKFRPSPGESDEAAVRRKFTEQIEPLFRPRFLEIAILSTFGAYFALYTILGLLLVATVPMASVQAQRRRYLEVTPTTIAIYTEDRVTTLLHWADLSLLILNNRRIFRRLLEFASSVMLIGPTNHIRIRGRVRHYWALTNSYMEEQLSAQHASNVKRIFTGYTMPHGFFGTMLFGTLTVLLLLIGLFAMKIDIMREPLLGTSYSATDLFGLLYLGVGLPFVYWFVVQPLRNYLIIYRLRYLLQIVALVSLLLGITAWLQFHYWHLPLGRPDFSLSALTIVMAGFVLHQHYWLTVGRTRDTRYFNAAILAALLAIGFAGRTVVQEARSFHWLTQGNSQFFKAVNSDDSAAPGNNQELYEGAIKSYEQAFALRDEPYIQNNIGTAWVQLGQYENAITHYKQAVDAYRDVTIFTPNELIYIRNLALAYRNWAGQSEIFEQQLQRYQEAAALYEQALNPTNKLGWLAVTDEDITDLREFLGATYFDLGTLYYYREGHKTDSYPYFEKALQHYETLLAEHSAAADTATLTENNKHRLAAGYVGKGWSEIFLRDNPDSKTKRQKLEEAVAAFKMAITYHSKYSPAFNGLGWAHWFISSESIFSDCIDNKFQSADDKVDYIYQITEAVKAFDEGVNADEGNGYFFRTRAQLNYILASCGLPYIRSEQLLKSIADYNEAVLRDPRAEWFLTLGNLHIALIKAFEQAGQTSQIRAHYELAAAAYLGAVAVAPTNGTALGSVREVYSQLGKSNDELLDDILHAMGRTDSDVDLIALVRSELQRGVYGLATIALERLLARNPDSEMGWLLMARTQFAWAERYTGENQPGRYARAIEAAQQAIDLGTDDRKHT